MPTSLIDPDQDLSIAELLRKLGNVSPDRVLLHPTPGTATEDDVLWYEARASKRLYELIDGTLVEKAMGALESVMAGEVHSALRSFVKPRNLGIVATPDGMVRMATGRIRIPDVAFFSWDRLPNRALPTEPIFKLAPNLAVEVLSVSNTEEEMRLKRKDYFKSGVELVWEIDHRTRSIRVYTDVNTFLDLSGNAHLDGGSVLPGFTIPLPELFSELDRHG